MATLATSTPSFNTTLDPAFWATMAVIVVLFVTAPFITMCYVRRLHRHSPGFALRELAPHIDARRSRPLIASARVRKLT